MMAPAHSVGTAVRRGLRSLLPGAPVGPQDDQRGPGAAPVDPVPSRGARAPLPFLEPEELAQADRAAVHMIAALLLTYPDEGERERRAAVLACLPQLSPSATRADLEAFLAATADWDAAQLASHYVDTFDLRRRCALHLSYYSSGDTRRRGMALVTFGEAFQAAGFEVGPDELPDHLALVLELSARGQQEIAGLLLGTHREGIELLRSALRHATSPYAHVLEAVCRTLPAVSPEAAERLTDLLAAGPPQELVGLSAPLLPFPTMRTEATPEGVRS